MVTSPLAVSGLVGQADLDRVIATEMKLYMGDWGRSALGERRLY